MADQSSSLDDLLQRGFRYALSLTHDRTAAEDLLQEACLRISRRGGPWQAGYLLKAIRNRCIDDVRREARVRFEPLDALPPLADAEEGDHENHTLERALGRLSSTERELIFLHVVEEYTAAEIAEMTGKPRGTILSAVHRAKRKLQSLLPGGEEKALP